MNVLELQFIPVLVLSLPSRLISTRWPPLEGCALRQRDLHEEHSGI